MSRADATDGGSPSLAVVGLLLGTLVALTIIGSSAVAVALPEVGDDLGLGTAGRAWVLAIFSLTFAVSTAVFGRLGDLVGLRRPLLAGGGVLVLGSVLAGLAPTGGALLAARAVQGAGAGAVPVLVTGVVAAVVPPSSRGAAYGAITAVVSIVSGSGPFLGGVLTDLLSWRVVVAVPALALLLLAPAARLAPDDASDPGGRLDGLGLAVVTAVTTGLVVLLQTPSTDPPPAVVVLAAVALVGGLAVVVVRHRRTPSAFPDPRLLGRPAFLLVSFGALTLLAAYLGLLFAVPELLAAGRGWSPLRIGLVLLPAAAFGAVASRVLGGRAARLGHYRLAAGLCATAAAGLALAAVGADTPVLLVAAFGLASASFGAGQAALLDTLPLLVPPEVERSAFGVFNLVFFTGGAVGSAWTGGMSEPLGVPGALATLAVLPLVGVALVLGARRAAAGSTAP